VALAACHASRGPLREAAESNCGDEPARSCESRCPVPSRAARDTREGACEAALADLCRAGCEQRCGDQSRALSDRIERADRYLEAQCGSGRSVDAPAERLAPTPHPLNNLLR
jgi:hypothetical protein